MAKTTRKPSASKSFKTIGSESNKGSMPLTAGSGGNYDTGDIPTHSLRRSMNKLARSYRRTAVEHFSRLAAEVEAHPALSHAEKVSTLVGILSAIAEVVGRLSRSAPKEALELWDAKSENAFQFTLRVYHEYIDRGLCKADIRSLDPTLYQGILDRERRHPEDKSVRLPTKQQINDKLLKEFASLSAITDSIPEIFRRRVRLYRTASVRRHKRQKKPAP